MLQRKLTAKKKLLAALVSGLCLSGSALAQSPTPPPPSSDGPLGWTVNNAYTNDGANWAVSAYAPDTSAPTGPDSEYLGTLDLSANTPDSYGYLIALPGGNETFAYFNSQGDLNAVGGDSVTGSGVPVYDSGATDAAMTTCVSGGGANPCSMTGTETVTNGTSNEYSYLFKDETGLAYQVGSNEDMTVTTQQRSVSYDNPPALPITVTDTGWVPVSSVHTEYDNSADFWVTEASSGISNAASVDGVGTWAAVEVSPTEVTAGVENDSGNWHGLTVGTDSTTLSGGTNSTTQTLNDSGMTISDSANGTTFTVDTVGNITATGNVAGVNGNFSGNVGAVDGNFSGNVTAAGTVQGSTVTDGAGASMTGGVVTGNTITDGTATLSGGNLTTTGNVNAANGTFTGTVSGASLTDGTATLSGGSLTGAVNGTFSGTVTANTFNTGSATFSGNTLSTGSGDLTVSAEDDVIIASDTSGGAGDIVMQDGGTEVMRVSTGGVSINRSTTVTGNVTASGTVQGSTVTTGAGASMTGSTVTASTGNITTVNSTNVNTTNATVGTLTTSLIRADNDVQILVNDDGGTAGQFIVSHDYNGAGAEDVIVADQFNTYLNSDDTRVAGVLHVGTTSLTLNGATDDITGSGNSQRLDITDNDGVSIADGNGTASVTVSGSTTTVTGSALDVYSTTYTNGYSVNTEGGSVNTSGGSVNTNGGNINTSGGDIDMGGTGQIHNLANGTAPMDAVNLRQLDDAIDDLDGELSGGIASALALSYVQLPSAPGKTAVSGGVGHYNGETGFGVNVTHAVSAWAQNRGVIGAGVAGATDGDVAFKVHAGFEF